MTTHMDRFGRVLVPKPIRDSQGLKSGMKMEAVPTPDGVLLKQLERLPAVKREKGVLVYTGDVPVEMTDWVADSRSDRIRKLMGL